MHTYIHTYTDTDTDTHTHVWIYKHMYVYICIHTGYVPCQKSASCVQLLATFKSLRRSSSLTRTASGVMSMPLSCPNATRTGQWLKSHGLSWLIRWLSTFFNGRFCIPKTGDGRNFQPRNNLMHCDWRCWRNMVGLGPWRSPWLMIFGWCGEGFHPFALMIWTHSHVVDGAKCGQNAESHLTLHEHSANNLCLYFLDPFASLQHLQMDFLSQLNQKCSLEECCSS